MTTLTTKLLIQSEIFGHGVYQLTSHFTPKRVDCLATGWLCHILGRIPDVFHEFISNLLLLFSNIVLGGVTRKGCDQELSITREDNVKSLLGVLVRVISTPDFISTIVEYGPLIAKTWSNELCYKLHLQR